MIWDSNTPQFLHLQAMVKIVKKWELKKNWPYIPLRSMKEIKFLINGQIDYHLVIVHTLVCITNNNFCPSQIII